MYPCCHKHTPYDFTNMWGLKTKQTNGKQIDLNTKNKLVVATRKVARGMDKRDEGD